MGLLVVGLRGDGRRCNVAPALLATMPVCAAATRSWRLRSAASVQSISTSPTVWGKLARDERGTVVREQTLAAHCRDVAGVFAALLEVPGIARRLATLAGMTHLPPAVRARLTYLVHLHDCGKVNAGFQARHDARAPVVGHVAPLAAIIRSRHADVALSRRALFALGAERLAEWGQGVCELLDAILSHHGKPWGFDDDRRRDVRHWRMTPTGYDPIDALAAIRADADAFLPDVHVAGAAPLPTAAGFVHAIAGLAQLADWIASSGWEHAPSDADRASWAARRLQAIGLDPTRWRATLTARGPLAFETLFDRAPYPHQREAAELTGRLLVLESETGSGKTEAALWRFTRLFAAGDVDGLFFALPTRTAAVQLHARVERFAKQLWPDTAPSVVLAVPGYLDDTMAGEAALPPAPDSLDGAEDDLRGDALWASEHPKRYFAGVLGVGTVDQALLATLRVKHAHMRGAALTRHLLVVDEVHASDSYMRRLLGHLLRDHLAAGGHAMLLSATLGAQARHQFLIEAVGERARDHPGPALVDARQIAYPLLSAVPGAPAQTVAPRGVEKDVDIATREWLDDPDAIARAALDAARAGAKVLIVRNTVDGAVAVQRALEAIAGDESLLFYVHGVPTLHHGRFAREDRRLLDAAVERVLGRTRPTGGAIVVGTQTLEQSLDLDADLLFTDLCPADVLLQRLGRLHRHAVDGEGTPRVRAGGFSIPRAVVLVPEGGLAPFLAMSRPGGLRRHGLGFRMHDGVPTGVYRDLTILERTRRLIEERPQWRIPEMNRALVEDALHTESVDALIESMPDETRDRWWAHRYALEGDGQAMAQIATDSVLWRDRPFTDESNRRFGDRLATRLGADDRLVELPQDTVGPFGQVVRRLAIPEWLARGIPEDATPAIVADIEKEYGVLRIRLGDTAFIYDRHGLRRAEGDT